MTPDLAAAIEDLYGAFAYFRRGRKINCYPGWEPPDADVALLINAPLREIPADSLARYAHAVTAYGRPDDAWWPFYLPRIFEHIANYSFPDGSEMNFLLYLLHSANDLQPPRWREEFDAKEVAPLDRVVTAFWSAHFMRPYHCITAPGASICGKESGGAYAFELIQLFAGAGFPAELMTSAWDASQGRLADLYLADMIGAVIDEAGQIDLRPWADGEHVVIAKALLAQWASNPALGQRVSEAFLAEQDEPELRLLSLALDRLEAAGTFA